MTSDRLTYQPVSPATLDDFHLLVQDDHVRRYLMDGELFPREWSAQRVHDSISLFDRRGVGLWLAYDSKSGELAGFCGFLEYPPCTRSRNLQTFLDYGATLRKAIAIVGHNIDDHPSPLDR